jgi:C4-dicarboxylate-specific signal transduction histidine kinase
MTWSLSRWQNRLPLAALLVASLTFVGAMLIDRGIAQREDRTVGQLVVQRLHLESITNIRRDMRKTYVAMLERWLTPRKEWPVLEGTVQKALGEVMREARAFSSETASPEEGPLQEELLNALAAWSDAIQQAIRSRDAAPANVRAHVEKIDRIIEVILRSNSAAARENDQKVITLQRFRESVRLALAIVLPTILSGFLAWRVRASTKARLETAERTRREQDELNATLERVVAERTEALRTTNDDLRHNIEERTRADAQLAANLEKLRQSQTQLLQAGKMVAIGQLAAGVAHEINNPLAVILGFAQGMERRIANVGDQFRVPVSSIVRETLRCKNLVQELLIFSRTAKKTAERVDINELIRVTIVLLEARARTQGVEIVQDLAEPRFVIEANRTQLQQVLVNLGTNAMDAMRSGGTLTIRTRRNGRDDFYMKVADTGEGIPDEIKPRIFDPFFTTKEVGKGTGLGLSLVYEIVQQHQGSISVESGVGRGTTMTVRLPFRSEGAAA